MPTAEFCADDFTTGAQFALKCIYDSNWLIRTARNEANEAAGGKVPCNHLCAEINSFCTFLARDQPAYLKVSSALRNTTGKPVAAGGIVARTAHCIANEFGRRVWSTIHTCLINYRVAQWDRDPATINGTVEGCVSGYIFDADDLLTCYEEIRAALAAREFIDQTELPVMIGLEAEAAKDALNVVKAPTPGSAPTLVKKLLGWTAIFAAIEMDGDEKLRRSILEMNKKLDGPIKSIRGGKVIAGEAELIEWWNGLEKRMAELEQRKLDKSHTVATTYADGKRGTAVPGIDGKTTKRPSGNSRAGQVRKR